MLELEHIKQLDDDVLIERLTQSVQRDRQLSVEILIELSEVQQRGLFRDLGFSTMFDYATRRLGMSESEAAVRLRAAKLICGFPIALEMLGRCEIHLTALGILAPVLTPDNIQLLYEARFKTKQQVLELVAKYAPKPDVRDSIRRMPRPSAGARPSARAAKVQNARSTRQAPLFASTAARATTTEHAPPVASTHAPRTELVPSAAASAAPLAPTTELVPPVASTAPHAPTTELVPHAPSTAPHAPTTELVPPAPSAAPHAPTTELVPHAPSTDGRAMPPLLAAHARPMPAAELVPLSPDRHKITFTASQRVRDMLEEARELRRHRDPAGQLEALFERALELLIADEKKRRFGQTAKPRKPRQAASPKPRSRYIPHEVRRQVWRRDGGQCCFRAPNGMRCGSRSRLEFHHKMPYERGGPTSTDNLELMCTSHNALLAERDYGRSFILQVRRARSHAREPHTRDPGCDSERARVARGGFCSQQRQETLAHANASSPLTRSKRESISKQLASELADEQSTWPQL